MRIFLGILVFLVWGSFCRYGYVCTLKGLCEDKKEEPIETPRHQTLDLILDDSITYLKNYDQFVFRNGLVEPDLNANNEAYLDSLASVLKGDDEIFLTLIGLYRPSEAGKSAGFFEDYGKARANEIVKLLVRRGVAEKQLSTDSKLGDGETLIQPIEFLLTSDRSGSTEEYVTAQFKFYDMNYSDANFEKDSPIFTPGEALITYADSVKTYLGLFPNDTLTIIGYCDVDGTDAYNLKLGQDRAENAKKYFVDLGVTALIITKSKGENEQLENLPADMDPEVVKQKNRRVRFLIGQSNKEEE